VTEQPQSPYLFDIRSPYTIGLSDLQLRLEPLLLALMEEGSPHATTVQGALDCLLQVVKRDRDFEAAFQIVQAGGYPCRTPGCHQAYGNGNRYLRDNHEHAHQYGEAGCGDPECEFYCAMEDDDDE